MLSDQSGTPDIATVLSRIIDGAENAEKVAERLANTWSAIDQALAPILGPLGVAALYRRSVYVAAVGHPWLSAAVPAVDGRIDVALLAAVVATQDAASATAAGAAIFKNFCDLLTGLVGTSLARRLLASVAGPSPSAPTALDSTT